MTNVFKTTVAAALFAASAFGASAAFASGGDGEYYQGASPDPVQQMTLDSYSTQSITNDGATQDTSVVAPGDGDYYQGAEETN